METSLAPGSWATGCNPKALVSLRPVSTPGSVLPGDSLLEKRNSVTQHPQQEDWAIQRKEPWEPQELMPGGAITAPLAKPAFKTATGTATGPGLHAAESGDRQLAERGAILMLM